MFMLLYYSGKLSLARGWAGKSAKIFLKTKPLKMQVASKKGKSK